MRYVAALAAAASLTWITTTFGTTESTGENDTLMAFVGFSLIALFAAWRMGRR